ncbi:MAG: GNAT family N-acetyltransferase [Sphaerochaetaceae bacterium]
MVQLEYREEPREEDVLLVGRLLAATGFFTPEEQEIGVSLVKERLQYGPRCGYLFVFAEDGGNLAGYTCYGPIPGTLDGFDLYWIAVDPLLQNRSIGRRLLEFTEQRVLKQEGKRLYVETSSITQYAPTRSFYEHNGFYLEGQLADYYAPANDKMLYVKRLLSTPNS